MLVVILVILLALIFIPQWWVNRVMQRYSSTIEELPGSGSEFAQHLIDRFQLGIKVEQTEQGDHYDPQNKVVRLSKKNFHGKSLTALSIAAHEVGHAIQHHRHEPLLELRGKMVQISQVVEKFSVTAMMFAPILGLITRSPHLSGLFFILAFLGLFTSVIVHLISLPVEWDASFGKALPIIQEGEYLPSRDRQVVKIILTAAALTYLSAALASLLNIWRWLAILRR